VDKNTFESNIDIFGDGAEKCNVSKDTNTSGLEELPDSIFEKYCKKHYAIISHLYQIGLPKKDHQLRIITKRNFNAVQMINYIAINDTILDLKIAIYSINYNAALILIKLLDNHQIKKMEVLMSNLRNKAHREKEEIIKNLFIKHSRIDIFYCSSHAKLFSCQTEKNNFYTLEGSGNMSNNSRIEQYVIDNDEKLYEFTCQWFKEIKEFLKNKKELEIH